MTTFDPRDQKTPRLHGSEPNISPRAARASFAFAIIAFSGGAACIMGGHWSPGLILVLAGVAGTMTSLQAWQMPRCMKQRSRDDDHTA